MARQRPKQRGSSANPPAKKPSGASQLRGGVGDVESRKSGRYEFSRPEITDSLRKRMLRGIEGVHEATAAAAYQHLRSPDAGSRVYGKAFQSLPVADQQALLSRLSPEDASVVQRAFTDFVESEPQPESRSAGSREEKIRDVARKALQESQETVNLDAPSEEQPKVKSVFSKGQIEYTDKVVDQPGPEWTKGQTQRGYRLLTIAPAKPGDAPRYVREVLPQVLEAEQQRAAPQPVSPAAGSVVQTPRRDLPDPNVQTIDRIMPTDWDSAPEQTKRAAVEMTQIFDQIEEMERVFELARKRNPSLVVPEFLETAEGKRLAARMREIEGLHPEAVTFVEDDSLTTRAMPKDLLPEEEKLPREMTLSYHFGGTESQSLSPRWEERLDRRNQFNIPADAPNRMGWLQAVTRVMREEVDPATGKTKKVRRLRQGDPALEGGMGEVGLPYPTNLIGESRAVKAAREDLEFDPRGSTENYHWQRGEARQASKAIDESDINVTDEEIAAALAGADEFEDYDGMGAPVEDKTMLAESWAKPSSAEVLTYGTAEGSPSAVKKDRDFALREGMSMKDRLAEKLFRAAQEYMGGDLDAIASDRRSTGTISGYTDVEGYEKDYLSRKLEGGAVRKKASASSTPREISRDRLLNLDGLVPVWRGLIEDVQDGQVIVRRPTAKEIAGFLVDRAGIPDPSVASRLEGVVQASMADAEGLEPRTAKAKRLAGTVLPTGSKRAKNYIEPTLQQQRQVGDTRPRYTEEAQRLISKSQAKADADGWQSDTSKPTGFVADASQPAEQPALPAMEVDPAAVAAFGSRRAGAAGTPPSTNAGKGGKPPTNIAGLLAMLTGVGAGIGASGEAQAGEQPPLEMLAMARRRSVSRVTGSAAGAAPSTTATPAQKPAGKQTQQQAPKGGSGSKSKPKPQQAAAATTTQTQPAPQQPAPAQTPQPQTTKPPAQPWFPDDNVANFVRGAGKAAYPYAAHVGRHFPSYSLGTTAAFVWPVPQLVRAAANNWGEAAKAMGMGGGQAPTPTAPADDGSDPLDFLRPQIEVLPEETRPAGVPPLDRSTNRIMALRQLLG